MPGRLSRSLRPRLSWETSALPSPVLASPCYQQLMGGSTSQDGPSGLRLDCLQADIWKLLLSLRPDCHYCCVILSCWEWEPGPHMALQVLGRLCSRATHTLSPMFSGLPKVARAGVSGAWLSGPVCPIAPTCAPVRSRIPPECPPCLPSLPTDKQARQTEEEEITDRATGRPRRTDHRVEGAGGGGMGWEPDRQ